MGQGTRWHCPGLGQSELLRVCLWGVAAGGETEEEKIRVDVLENQVLDVCMQKVRICYSPDFVSPLPLGWAGQGPMCTGSFVS